MGTDYCFYPGADEVNEDECVHFRYYTRTVGDKLEAGLIASMMFRIDRPASAVWPYFKDFNLWQNQADHYYTGVVGDLEGKTFRGSSMPNDGGPHQNRVLRVIPEHLIVGDQPGPWDGGPRPYDGYNVFLLNEHAGKTTLTIMMQHAIRTSGKTPEEALDFWRSMEPQLVGKWRDSFISMLKKLVLQGG